MALPEALWIHVCGALRLADILALRGADTYLHSVGSSDALWEGVALRWARAYGPCSRDREKGTPWLTHFQRHVYTTISLELGPLKPVSVFDQSYYCVVDGVELTRKGVWVAFRVRGDGSLGVLQDPLASRLLMAWARPSRQARAGAGTAGVGGGEGFAAPPSPPSAPQVHVRPVRRLLSHEGEVQDRQHTLSGRLFLPKSDVLTNTFWSFRYGSGGYGAAPLARVPSARVPDEWRWPAPPRTDDAWWPGPPWLPRGAGLHPPAAAPALPGGRGRGDEAGQGEE